MFGPLACLLIGMGLILFLILVLRCHAFLALIAAALAVAFLSDRIPIENAIPLVTDRFGEMMGSLGLLLALAAIIGKCMMDSGAADRIVRGFSRVFGEGRENHSLLASSFVLGIPVFFDTVFYLLAPLARAVYARRKRDYVLIVCATAAGGAITHCLVPPTPGPIMVAELLNVSIGLTILVGTLASIAPVLIGGVGYAKWINKRMDAVPKDVLGVSEADLEAMASKPDSELPRLWLSCLPFLLPVILLAVSSTFLSIYGTGSLRLSDIKKPEPWLMKIREAKDPISLYLRGRLMEEGRRLLEQFDPSAPANEKLQQKILDDVNLWMGKESFYEENRFSGIALPPEAKPMILNRDLKKGDLIRLNRLLLHGAFPQEIAGYPLTMLKWVNIIGDKNAAFFGGALIGLWLLIRQKRGGLKETFDSLGGAIASGAIIAFITCAGASFGKALAIAGIGDLIAEGAKTWGLSLMVLAYLTSSLIRVAQGSATVAMITTAGILSSTLASLSSPLPYHPVYLVAAIGFGASGLSWMNDSGFWIFSQMTGLNETQTLKTWTVLLTIMGVTGFLWVCFLAWAMPLA
ncbi:MAG: SLC13 family permease [Candidatus Omnitrophota bacterium]